MTILTVVKLEKVIWNIINIVFVVLKRLTFRYTFDNVILHWIIL